MCPDHLFEDLVRQPVDPRRCVCIEPSTRSLYFFESEEFFAPDHAGTSDLSLERLYMREQALHDVLGSIGIIQARALPSSHQSLSDYFEGETPWVLLDFRDQDFLALKSDFLYALPQS